MSEFEKDAAVQLVAVLLVGGLLVLIALHFVVYFLFRGVQPLAAARMPATDQSFLEPDATPCDEEDPEEMRQCTDAWVRAREAEGATILRTRDGHGIVALGP